MSFILTILAGLFFIVFDSAYLPKFYGVMKYCDFAIPFLLALALFRPLRAAVAGALIFGFFQDNLSGAPFGVHMFAYIWIVLMVSGLTKYFDRKSRVIHGATAVLSVFIKNFIMLFAASVMGMAGLFSTRTLKILAFEILCTGCVAVLVVAVLEKILNRDVRGVQGVHVEPAAE